MKTKLESEGASDATPCPASSISNPPEYSALWYADRIAAMESERQQIMDRLEGRILCYQNAASRCKGGRKQYTSTQLELAKAQAMQEARIIVWMHNDEDSDVDDRLTEKDEDGDYETN